MTKREKDFIGVYDVGGSTMSPLVYLKKQLNFEAKEWTLLSDEDKQWYRNTAREEMEVLGIEVK